MNADAVVESESDEEEKNMRLGLQDGHFPKVALTPTPPKTRIEVELGADKIIYDEIFCQNWQSYVFRDKRGDSFFSKGTYYRRMKFA